MKSGITRSFPRLQIMLPAVALACGALAATVASCATSIQYQAGTSSSSAATLLSESQKLKIREFEAELELGRNMASRLLGVSDALQNRKVVDYVSAVGLYVARYSESPERKYMFEVLNDDSVNAFACPGGYIFVTTGALKMTESESELAAILGHEIAHVSRQHMLKAIRGKDFKTPSEKEREKNSKITKPASGEMSARRRPEPPQSEFGGVISQYLMGPGGAGLSLFAAVDAGMGILLKDGLDQKLEFEADQEGVRSAIRAGYDPSALGQYFSRLQKAKINAPLKNLETTHPKAADREVKLAQFLAAENKIGVVGATGNRRFLKIKALLLAEK